MGGIIEALGFSRRFLLSFCLFSCPNPTDYSTLGFRKETVKTGMVLADISFSSGTGKLS